MVDWIVLYLVSQGATLCVQSVCILRKVGDSTAQQRLFSASLPASLPTSLSLSYLLTLALSLPPSLSSPRCSTLRSASLHTAWPGTLFTLPAKWSLSGLSI